MKRLKEMKKSCIRALTVTLVVIVAMALVAQPALAKQPDNPLLSIEQEYTRATNKLERFLTISETGNIVLDAPKGIVNSIDSEVYQALLAGLEQTNALIDSGELVVNPDFTLTVAGMDSVGGIQTLSTSGGIDKTVYYWWGYKVWMSDNHCDQIVAAMGVGMSITWIVTMFLGPAAPIGVIVAALYGFGIALISYYNRNNTGIIIRFHYPGIPTGIWSQ